MAIKVRISPSLELPAHIQYGRQLNAEIKYNLSHSCAQTMTLKQLFLRDPEQLERLLNRPLEYASIQGDLALRNAIADFHQRHNRHNIALTGEDVMTFAGAQEGLAAVYKALLAPGDEVVVFTPSYPSLVNMVEQYGARVCAIPLSYDGTWQFDLEQLRASINNNTKLIVINSPHNPTGAWLNREQQQEILSLAQAYNCFLLSDDVTQPLVHQSASKSAHSKDHTLAHNFLDYDKTIVVSVLSKSFGLAGIRIGWVLTKNSQLLEQLLAIKAYGSICTSLVDELIAEQALKNADDIIANNLAIIRDNKLTMARFINEHQPLFSWASPEAGILSLLKVNTDTPLEQWLAELAQQSGVLLLPAKLFGLDDNFVRLGLGQKNFPEGLSALSQFCQKSLV